MIETVIMMASLVVLGYAFYISSRMLWIFKSEKGSWKWLYSLVSVFLVIIYFLLGTVMFSFLVSSFISQSIFNLLNIIVGIFFLSSAGLIGAVIRYHLSVMGSEAAKSIKTGPGPKEAKEEPEPQKETESPGEEIPGEAEKLEGLAVTRELKMLELRNRIRRLHEAAR